ncbi:MAG: cyclic pyranopterin monophosphate synthase MoaC [Phycisphaerae bacterium]
MAGKPKTAARRRRTAPTAHVDARGRARMVDVSDKRVTLRRAVAAGEVHMNASAWKALTSGALAKGDALAVARLAGIQAAKRTAELIPLCHPLPLDAIQVDVELASRGLVKIRAEARIRARTGVEMEALTAVSVAALAVYDMCKSLDRAMTIGAIRLLEKSGGRSGTYARDAARTGRTKRT